MKFLKKWIKFGFKIEIDQKKKKSDLNIINAKTKQIIPENDFSFGIFRINNESNSEDLIFEQS